MIIGEGAELLGRKHAKEYDMQEVDNSFFDVKERWAMLNDWRRQQGMQPLTGEGPIRGAAAVKSSRGGARRSAAGGLRRASSAPWAAWPTTSSDPWPRPPPPVG